MNAPAHSFARGYSLGCSLICQGPIIKWIITFHNLVFFFVVLLDNYNYSCILQLFLKIMSIAWFFLSVNWPLSFFRNHLNRHLHLHIATLCSSMVNCHISPNMKDWIQVAPTERNRTSEQRTKLSGMRRNVFYKRTWAFRHGQKEFTQRTLFLGTAVINIYDLFFGDWLYPSKVWEVLHVTGVG